MTASFKLTLDRTAVVAVSTREGLPSQVVLDIVADPDVVEVKVWGDIDPTDPANANYSETLEGADWFPFDPELALSYPPGPGPFVFHVQVRDDVWNESDPIEVSIGGVQEEVVPAIPGWPGSVPRPAKAPGSSRTITGRGVIRVASHGSAVRTRQALHFRTRVPARSRGSISRVGTFSSLVQIQVRSTGAITAAGAASETSTRVSVRGEVIRRRGHADDDAVLALLLS